MPKKLMIDNPELHIFKSPFCYRCTTLTGRLIPQTPTSWTSMVLRTLTTPSGSGFTLVLHLSFSQNLPPLILLMRNKDFLAPTLPTNTLEPGQPGLTTAHTFSDTV